MADDRWRHDRERNPSRGGPAQGRGSDYQGDGTIARRGFGNERSGYGEEHRGAERSGYDRGPADEHRGGYRGAGADRRGGGDRYAGGGAYGSDYRGGGTAGGRDGRGVESRYGAQSDGRSDADRDHDPYGSGQVLGPEDFETPGYGDWGMPARRKPDERADRDEAHRPRESRGFWQAAADEVGSWFGGDDADRSYGGREERPNHRGRGPKGYTRSDERIREDVCERLTQDPYVDASDIEIAVSGREVTLSGFVDSREAKRRAEDLADHVSGVAHVQNNLRVRQPGMDLGPGGGANAGATSGGGLSSAAVSGGTGVEASRGEGESSRRRSGA